MRIMHVLRHCLFIIFALFAVCSNAADIPDTISPEEMQKLIEQGTAKPTAPMADHTWTPQSNVPPPPDATPEQVKRWTALNSGSHFDIHIAVRINENDMIVGALEYANDPPQYSLQLVTFNANHGEPIMVEPYLFEIYERIIVSEKLHRIKCRSINDKYGSQVSGTIDFRTPWSPKVHLENVFGHTYIDNITEKGKETAKKYIPSVLLGF
jgi:hypothetical protein